MDELSEFRVPPHSTEAEQAVIGGLMLSQQAWEKVADKILVDNFYRQDHRLIFGAIQELSDKGQPCDVVTLSEYLDTREKLDEAGGIAYLGQLAKETPSAANIGAYADIVREKALLRALIEAGTEITDDAFRPEGRSTRELVDKAERKVFSISESNNKSGQGFRKADDVLTTTVSHIEKVAKSKQPITGLSTGLVDLDEKTAGLQKGDLVIVAGRPSMGKTSFAMNIGEYVALAGKESVAVFSMEMPADQLMMRLISSNAQIDQSLLRTGRLRSDDWPRLTSAVTLLGDSRIFIDDSGGLSPTEVRARARRLKREHGLGLIIIDYLQLMTIPGSKEGRTAEISEISRSLKGLAKELEVPVIALSQLNRNLESRPDKRPVNSDLRESGGIEQDADVIIFIYRDEVYNKNTSSPGVAEIIIGKQRNGPIGTVRTAFRHQFTRFENLAADDEFADNYGE